MLLMKEVDPAKARGDSQITIRECAAFCGLTVSYIYRLIRDGTLTAERKRPGYPLLIPLSEARRIQHKGKGPGRPRTGVL